MWGWTLLVGVFMLLDGIHHACRQAVLSDDDSGRPMVVTRGTERLVVTTHSIGGVLVCAALTLVGLSETLAAPLQLA